MTNQTELQLNEGFVHEVVPVIAHAQAAGVVQPAQTALNGPAFFSQPTAVRCAAPGQFGRDALLSQFVTVRLRVISPVAQQLPGATTRASSFALHRRHRIKQGPQLRDVVAVGSGDRHAQRHAPRIDEQVMFGAGPSAVGRVGADGLAVFSLLKESLQTPTARTLDESTHARDQSNCPAWCNFDSSKTCKAFHTPSWCHALSRRQQVIPEPQPISCGRYSHGTPLFKTKRMPVSAARSLRRGRPPLGLAGSGGNRGSISRHNASSKSGFAMPRSLQNKFC